MLILVCLTLHHSTSSKSFYMGQTPLLKKDSLFLINYLIYANLKQKKIKRKHFQNIAV